MIAAHTKRKLVVAILETKVKTPSGITKFKIAAIPITTAEIITAVAGTDRLDKRLILRITGR